MNVELLDGEVWWGGRVADGLRMPLSVGTSVDLAEHGDSQASSLLVSSHGRVVRGTDAFSFAVEPDALVIDGLATVETAGDTLRDAVRWCAEHVHHQPRSMPHVDMFSPQWALWIELLYEPTQAATLAYADAVLHHGYAPGVVMIDDNWSEDYGVWKFRSDRFPDPGAMVRQLHDAGFGVMLWTCPYVSPDGRNYLDLRDQGLLIREPSGEPAIRRWWNGYSAVLDLTNPTAVDWYRSELDQLRSSFGIDGFKFDGGDVDVYRHDDLTHEATTPADQVHRYGAFASTFHFNELRSGWNLGGLGVATRISDANHSWDEHGLGKLIGNQLAQGLLGMPFSAPDMIGGGQYLDFDEDRIDPEVFVRHAQIAAFSPMMQFSAAPWRLLDDEHAAAVRAAAAVRIEHQDLFVDLAQASLRTGDPIIRPLEYEFPHRGLHTVTDAFMVGPDLLVAPVVEQGATTRTIVLPPGTWQTPEGQQLDGDSEIEIAVNLTTIPRFHRVS